MVILNYENRVMHSLFWHSLFESAKDKARRAALSTLGAQPRLKSGGNAARSAIRWSLSVAVLTRAGAVAVSVLLVVEGDPFRKGVAVDTEDYGGF